jgi:ubiquinone/menaquinone biosynthesis C-methylase UbiE
MLAPRKKLWSTPKEAILTALDLLRIDEGDIVYDIGCGEGNFLQLALERTRDLSNISIRGVEIEEERAKTAHETLSEQGYDESRLSIIIGNALEFDYSDGTVFFLYLIPRGLRLILPKLKSIPHPVRVVTFMNSFAGEIAVSDMKISTPSHSEAQWPLFYYELNHSENLSIQNQILEENNADADEVS